MSKMTTKEALQKLRELPENAPTDEIEKAELDLYNAYNTDDDATLDDLYNEPEDDETPKIKVKFNRTTALILDALHKAKPQQENRKTPRGHRWT